MKQPIGKKRSVSAAIGQTTIAGWLLARFARAAAPQRLNLLERITLAPRQSLALVEADGRRLLVATSAESGPVFYALDINKRPARPLRAVRRTSW